METEYNFNSSVCSSVEQSQRLLSLGLKRDTADCHWLNDSIDNTPHWVLQVGLPNEYFVMETPGRYVYAWSLDRLIEIYTKGSSEEYMLMLPDTYDEVIGDIETAIRQNQLDRRFLEKKKEKPEPVRCPDCSGRMALVTGEFSFYPDDEPFESGKEEYVELKEYRASLSAMVCESCGKITDINPQ